MAGFTQAATEPTAGPWREPHGGLEATFALLQGEPHLGEATPADAVFVERHVRLLRYRPRAAHLHRTPLLIIPSALNRARIFDLTPERSMVAALVARHFDVYMLDWGALEREDRAATLDDYLTGTLRRAIAHVRAACDGTGISLLGYSMGGTFAAIYSALFGEDVRNLIELAAPINFHDDGVLSQWTRKDRFNVDLVVDTLGAMPPDLMRASFEMLTPSAEIGRRLALAEQIGDAEIVQDLLAMQRWVESNSQFLGEAYRAYVKECYQENHLIQGKLVIGGRRVDLTQITCPLLVVTAAKDHLCPPQSAAILTSFVSSADVQTLELPTGHVGLVAGPLAAERLWPALADWLAPRSE